MMLKGRLMKQQETEETAGNLMPVEEEECAGEPVVEPLQETT